MNSIIQQSLCVQRHSFRDESGYQMEMDRVSFNNIDLKWASYINPEEKTLTFHPEKSAIISHFRLEDPCITIAQNGRRIREKQFVVYREATGSYDFKVSPTLNKNRSFFELNMTEDFFDQLFTDDSAFLTDFHNTNFIHTPSFDFTADMVPAMYGIINDMKSSPYAGHLKGLYLEAKSIELFLLQVAQLDH